MSEDDYPILNEGEYCNIDLHYDEDFYKKLLRLKCLRYFRLLTISIILMTLLWLLYGWFGGGLHRILIHPKDLRAAGFATISTLVILLIYYFWTWKRATGSGAIARSIQSTGKLVHILITEECFVLQMNHMRWSDAWGSKIDLSKHDHFWKLKGLTYEIYFPLNDLTSETRAFLEKIVTKSNPPSPA